MSRPAALLRATGARYLSALAYRDYRTMWWANLSAQAAAWALIVTRGGLIYDMTHSSMDVGLVTFAAMVPQLLVPPFAGVLADRMDRRTLLAWTYALNLFHNLALAALSFSGAIAEWQVVALALVNGSARAAQMSTSQALAAGLVPRERLLNALSLNSATMHGARLLGPALVAPVLALVGAPAAFLLCTLLYGVGWFQVTRIRTSVRGGVQAGERFLTSFGAGLRYAWQQPLIRMVVLIMFFHCGLTMAFESLLPALAERQRDLGAAGFGSMMTAVGAGSLIGSILVGGVESGRVRGGLFLALGLLSGLGQALLAAAPVTAIALLALGIMGLTQAGFMTLGMALTQALAANDYRGRIASLNIFSLGGVMAFMNLLNGALAGQLDAALILLGHGLIFAAIMAFTLLLALPRRVYVEGLPAEAVATPV